MKKLKWVLLCLLLPLAGIVSAQSVTVQGTVTDANGSLPGVSVAVKGTANVVLSDVDGKYSIAVTGSETVLVFSYMGYATQEIAVAGRRTIDVTLAESAKFMDEVVVIGYGTQRKSDLSMAVSTVKIDKTLKSQTSNLNTMLQGQIPGLTIQSSGGDPLRGATVTLRGRGSRDYDGVLWVVDGVPGASYAIEDVESVTVLKDAASAAIYGAQVGASGVIIITTKKAQAGKAKVDVNVQHGFKNVWRKPEVVTAEQYNQLWRDALDATTSPTATLPMVADPARYPYGTVTRTDWVDEVLRTGQTQHYAISLSGGSESIKALGSFSYDRNEGIMLNTYSESLNGKVEVDFQPTKWLRIAERLAVNHSRGLGNVWNESHQGILLYSVFYPRSTSLYEYAEDGTTPVLNEKGEHAFSGTIPQWAVNQGVSGYGEIQNPVAQLSRMNAYNPSLYLFSTSTLELKPFDGLTFRSDFTRAINPVYSTSNGYKSPEYGLPSYDNGRSADASWYIKNYWENILTYVKAIDEHHISAMAGYTQQYEKSSNFGVYTRGYEKEDEHFMIFPNAQNWESKPGEGIWESWMYSYVGRLGYSWADRYFLTASVRHDVSSKLHPSNNSGTFPAFSGSWKISSEEFFNIPAINLLKVRGGWGQVGNVGSVNRYSYNVSMAMTGQVVFGKDMWNMQNGLYQGSIPNPDLTWETSEQTSLGVDATLFNHSLTITVDWYRKLTKDLIDDINLPQTAGISTMPKGNVGKVLNTGFEFAANYNKKIGAFNLNVYGNLSTVHSEVLDLGTRLEFAHGNSVNGGTMKPLFSEVGQAWYSYKLIKTDGIFQTQTEIDNYVKNGQKIQPNAVPGDLKFVDYNDDGMISDEDRQFMGSYLPELTYSFGASGEWKGFDFSFFFQGISGVNIFNGFKMMGMNGRGVGNYMLASALDNWTYDHQSKNPRITLFGDPNNNFTAPSDFLLEDGSYLRLKSLTIGYTLPKSLLAKAGISELGLRIYATGENLLTLTGYTGFDPEVGNMGLDVGTYPIARTFTFGLNLNF
ncbi:MAG: TonB-dependent receptor [Prevotellaceae bacterium]|jgi:TonB-linked SusC/RagA family outer membrane protein|nr:TonB-dependent receptor [Prevotellaceae bacterium]